MPIMSQPIANRGLADLLKRRDLTIKEVSHGAGVHRASIHHWLHGRPSPRLEERVAATLGVAPATLRKQVGIE
jgi:lambda repressor-like predicted transcriptional regulator